MNNELSVVQMKEKRVKMRQSVSKGQEEYFARREGWSSAISDRRAKRSVKRSKYGFSGRGEGVRGKGNGR